MIIFFSNKKFCIKYLDKTQKNDILLKYAAMAQQVEHVLGKDEVVGSNPIGSSRSPRTNVLGDFFIRAEITLKEQKMYRSKMMIVMRRDLKMRKGKIAAQAGHACIDAILAALCKEGRLNDFEMTADGMVLKNANNESTPLSDWFCYGCAKVCVYVDSEEALLDIAEKASEKGIIASVITDAGMTEFHGIPTKTCLALEPLPVEIADELTGSLPLY